MRVSTTARYRGLAVTVLGDTRAGLLAIAGYGTAQELAIAAIAVKRRRGQRVTGWPEDRPLDGKRRRGRLGGRPGAQGPRGDR